MSRRGAARPAAAAFLLAFAGGCVLIQIPLQILVAVLNGVFRLGAAGVNAAGSAAKALGPYLLFWAANDPSSDPTAADLERRIARAARERPLVAEGIERAGEARPPGAEFALVVPLEEVLAEGGLRRTAARLRGRRLLAVTFARLEEPPAGGAPPSR